MRLRYDVRRTKLFQKCTRLSVCVPNVRNRICIDAQQCVPNSRALTVHTYVYVHILALVYSTIVIVVVVLGVVATLVVCILLCILSTTS